MKLGTVRALDAAHIMSGRQRIGAEFARHVEEIGEFDLLVAAHAGNGRKTLRVGIREIRDHAFAEPCLVVEYVMRNGEPLRHAPRIVDILSGAAGALFLRRGAVIVKLQRDADCIITLALQETRDDGGIDAARHGDDNACVARLFGEAKAVSSVHGRAL